jgi:hypothetical protein
LFSLPVLNPILRAGQTTDFKRDFSFVAPKGLTVYKTDLFTVLTKTVSTLHQHVAASRMLCFFRERKASPMKEFQGEITLCLFAPVIGVFNRVLVWTEVTPTFVVGGVGAEGD